MGGLRGFASLRTRPAVAGMEREYTYCQKCGARLRRSNPGPLCMPCEGVPEIPEWITQIAESDSRPATTDALVALILGTGRMEQMKARIEAVCDGYKSGLTVLELATGHNLSAYQVRHIISEHKGSHEALCDL